MGDIIKNTDSGLWVGVDGGQYGGDDIFQKDLRKPQNVLQYVSTATYGQGVISANQANPALPLQVMPSNFGAILRDNKWLFLGGLAVLGYFFFSGGLAANDRTVTSVTRYAPKR